MRVLRQLKSKGKHGQQFAINFSGVLLLTNAKLVYVISLILTGQNIYDITVHGWTHTGQGTESHKRSKWTHTRQGT